MSFTSRVKEELSHREFESNNQSIMELNSFIKRNGNISIINQQKYLEIIINSATVAKRIYTLFQDLFDVKNIQIIVIKEQKFNKLNKYILKIKDIINYQKELRISSGYNDDFIIKLLEERASRSAYFRGLFLACGSINDPQSSFYHLEFIFNHISFALFIKQQLNNYYELEAKIIQRRNKKIVYVKKADKIADFLKIIGANETLFEFEDIRIKKDFTNSINRVHNIDIANLEKTINASINIIKQITKLQKLNGLYYLNDKEQIICQIRVKYPELTFNQITLKYFHQTDGVISKSIVNHTFRKIRDEFSKS